MTDPEEAFLQRLRATFQVEAAEHMQAMSAELVALEREAGTEAGVARIEVVFRHAHSLKGAARAINLSEVETVCQALEDVFVRWKRGEMVPAAADFDVLHRAVDLLGRLAGTGGSAPARQPAQQIVDIRRQLAELTMRQATDVAPASPEPPKREDRMPAQAIERSPAPPAAVPTQPLAAAPADTIRISTAKLDQVLLEAEEMLAVKQSAVLHARELQEVERAFDDWAKRWARVQPQAREEGESLAPELGEFLDWNLDWMRAMEGRLRALGKTAMRNRFETARRVDDLLGDSKALVMLPFAALADGFPKIVRDLARDEGKAADLVVRGGEVEIDKRILEEIKDPLVHLLRNSLDHGVERPDLRTARGKPGRATIAIAVAPIDGNKVEISVSDDGGGIEVARVKASAVKRGLLPAAEAAALGDEKALAFIFQSEVSTSPIVTELSGRGLGLAIVRERADKLGGRVSVESRPGQGTTFRLVVPLKLSTFRGVLVGVAGQVFVLPTAQVERVARVAIADVKTVENRETISLAGQALSLARMENVLEIARRDGAEPAREFLAVAILASAGERIAFAVDEVMHDEEVLVKSLGRPLSRVRNVAGATVLASGRVVPVLNVTDLMKSAHRAAPGTVVSPATASVRGAGARAILLAEDSITSRMLLKGILESAGYRVKTAVDGVDAFTLLRSEPFDLVVSDIEMPRMNGFDLTARIRADRKLAETPVVLVTALSSSADRERGIEVGANAYIVKSSFDQSNLLGVVRRLV